MTNQKMLILGVIIIISIGIIGSLLYLMLIPPVAIYDGNLTLSGTVQSGQYVDFSSRAGDNLTIKISNFNSKTGHRFQIRLYNIDGIPIWNQYVDNNVIYTIEIVETGKYYLFFAIDSNLDYGEVSFHLLVKKG